MLFFFFLPSLLDLFEIERVRQRGSAQLVQIRHEVTAKYNNKEHKHKRKHCVQRKRSGAVQCGGGCGGGAVAEVDAATPIAAINTIEQTLDSQIRHLRLYMFLLGLFGAVAVILAAIGIYGVMAHSVTERTREIGVRMALGAGAPQVLRLVVKQATWLIGIGLILGVTSAVALSRVVRSALFQVTATDPVTYVAACALLLLIAAIACLIPTRRAASVDPAVALRGK